MSAIVLPIIGKTVTAIVRVTHPSDELLFSTECGKTYRMYHWQDCCETVSIEEIIGNLDDLLNAPLIMAEEVSENDLDAIESGTWTFYKFATINGYVTIRWYGASNGYYSESVYFEEV